MTPPFMYYGGKTRLAPAISALIPVRKAYVEPFAGSAAVLLHREPTTHEVLNDLNGDVWNFWTVLRDQTDELIGSLQMTPNARDEYLFCRDSSQEGLTAVERARRFFVVANMAFNASANGKTGYSFDVYDKGKVRTFIRKVDERLTNVAGRLSNVELENVDALKLISRWDDPRTSLYLDPPYMDSTRVSTGDYATDNGGSDFHEELIDRIRDFKGFVALSGYDHELYNSLGWRKVEFPVRSSASGKGRRVECVWVNDK